MCVGVATSNSILVVSFAKEQMGCGVNATVAALEASFTRFRLVIMTPLAMIIGMGPMALGMGEGGEQNAPLGRAVIGGLLFATVATLFFVSTVFSMLHGRKKDQEIGRSDNLTHKEQRVLTSSIARSPDHRICSPYNPIPRSLEDMMKPKERYDIKTHNGLNGGSGKPGQRLPSPRVGKVILGAGGSADRCGIHFVSGHYRSCPSQ